MVVSAGLLGTFGLAVLILVGPYEWVELYYRELVAPGLQSRYGFRLGEVSAFRDGRLYFRTKGFVEISPDGEFARLGVRAGDAPFGHHTTGFGAMFDALETAARGGFAALQVVNAHELEAGLNGGRTIPIPRVREIPGSLFYQNFLPSPAGTLAAHAIASPMGPAAAELWLWNSGPGSRKKVIEFERWGPSSASATWSADGKWLAVTDDSRSWSRCVLIEASWGQALTLNDLVMSLPAHARPASSDRLECEIFGWVQDRPTRVAVIFRDLAATAGKPWIYNLFFDVGSGQFIAAGQ